MMTNRELLENLQGYIKEGVEQSLKLFEGELLSGKIAAYNEIWDYIEYVLREEIE